jgi:pyruvate,water dikinase
MTSTAPIAVPPEFSFEWDSPEEALKFWTADLMHWPNGLSRLSATLDLPAFVRGMNTASQALCMPFSTVQFKWVRGYVYNSFSPYSMDPGEMGARMRQMQEKMMEHVPGLLERWQNEYEPETRSINDDTLKGDYRRLSDGDLSDLLETLVAKREREGELHFLAVFPAMGAVMFFEEMYTQLVGEPSAGEHLQLLQGFPNKTSETGVRLWQLAMEARRRPQVARAINELPFADVHAALPGVEGGAAFRDAMDEFLDGYGWRSNELDIASPTWKEEPSTAYKLVREYAARADYDPEQEQRSLASARAQRQRLVMERVPGEAAGMFAQVIAGAQQYLPIQEDHNFWIDQQGVAVERVPVLEAGRRLVESKRLDAADDVFYLDYAELQDALRAGSGDLHELVQQRRREHAGNLRMTPPPFLGTPPEVADDNPMVTKFFGGPPAESADPRIINGNPASAGTVTATARVILSLDDSERLQQGEVLVCPATMPPWTPLFGIASGVVTDHGGVLSHTAIVAREYQIPAVVGTKVGTSLIRDGQTVTVDGTAGTVRLEGD